MIYGDHIFQLGDDGALIAINKHTGHTFWQRRVGVLSASSPPRWSATSTSRDRARGARRQSTRAESSRSAARPARSCGRATCPAPASPRRSSTSGRVFFGSQNGHRVRAERPQRQRRLDLPRGGRGQGQPHPRRRRALLRRLLRPRAGDLRADRHGGCGISGSEGALLGSGTFYSTAAVDLRARIPRQHRRAHLRLRRVHRAARLGRADRRLRLRLARRHQRPRPRPDHLHRLLQRHLLRAERPLRARSPGSFNAHGRISGSATIVGRIVYFADLGHRRTYGLGISTGRVVVRDGHRLLRPGDQRRAGHLPDRLHRPVRARARR